MTRTRLARIAALLLLAGLSASCAYYNTFYLARRYYMKATTGQPYEVDREGTTQRANYTKSADYSKKLLGVHPKSKWVDDAWLMWARTLVGTDDPLKAVAMLQEFETRFPKSELRPDAEFFLGLSYRAARRHEQAVERFDNFLAQAPRHELVPYAWYERSRALLSLGRHQEAASSAGQVLERFPRHVLVDRALRQRAEARYQQRAWQGAREDFRTIGARALTDDDRLKYLLREVDCLEASREYEPARALLRDARSHVPLPPPVPALQRLGTPTGTAAGALPPAQRVAAPTTPGQDKYGRLTLRMGGVELLAGRVKEAIGHYETVIQDYPRTQLAAEAQFRIGFAHETGAEDFARARAEYLKVREQTGTSQFAQQAQQRLDNLDRIDRFRTASGVDSVARKAESRFLTAEHYLYNLDRPERALEEYRSIADSSADSALVARALNAQAWVLARKLGRPAAADSLFWKVVREHPATEAQLAARDYLEAGGQTVPSELIVPPKEPVLPLLDLGDTLTPPPGGAPQLGGRRAPLPMPLGPGGARPGVSADSLRRMLAARDTLLRSAGRDTSVAGRARLDSLQRSFARADTAGRAALMAEIAQRTLRPDSVVLAPDDSPAPDLGAAPDAERITLPRPPPITVPPLPAVQTMDRPGANAEADSLRSTLVDSSHAARLQARMAFQDSIRRAAAASVALPRRDSVRTDSAGVRHALVPDSLRKQATVVRPPPAPMVPAREQVTPAEEGPRSYGISSFGPSPADSLRKAKKAEARRVKKAAADSVRRAKAVQDSLKRLPPRPAAPAAPATPKPPDPPKSDSAAGRRP